MVVGVPKEIKSRGYRVALTPSGAQDLTSDRPTTHDTPVYEAHGIIHYCVTNMPGAYPRTSTLALTNSTLPYIKKLAAGGTEKLIREDPALRSAANTYKGAVVHEGFATSAGLPLGKL